MTSRSVGGAASRQRSSGCVRRLADRLCRARLPISSDSLARSATEIRDHERLIVPGARLILPSYPQDSEADGGRPIRGHGAEMRSHAAQPRGVEAVDPAPARLWIGQVQRQACAARRRR